MSGQDTAACRGTDVMMLFFGPDDETQRERGMRERKAKMVCAACPLRPGCLEDALQHSASFGVWGGLSPGELVAERRRRHRGACAAVSRGDS